MTKRNEDAKKSNEVVQKEEQQTLPTTNNKSVFGAYGDAANTRLYDGELLIFSKGDYLLGKDKREIPIGTRVQAHMHGLMIGWVKWDESKPGAHVVGLLIENFQPPRRGELGDLDKTLWPLDDDGEPRDPWQFCNYLPMNDRDDPWTFTTSSKGGLNAIAALCAEFDHWMRKHPNKNPAVELGVDSYQHPNRSYGRIKFPVFKIIDEGDERVPDPAPALNNLTA